MGTTTILLNLLTSIAVFGILPLCVAALFLRARHRAELANPDRYHDPAGRTGDIVTGTLGVAVGIGLWLVWFSWGDPAHYASWSVTGCAITAFLAILLLGFAARWRYTGPFCGAYGGLFAFSASYAVDTAFYDESGLWGVGYFSIVLGGGVLVSLIALGIMLIRTPKLPHGTRADHR